MSTEIASLLPTIAKDRLPSDINLQVKDGDPRKTAYTIGLLHRFPDVVNAWREVGLLKPIRVSSEEANKKVAGGESIKIRGSSDGPHYERRKNMAGEHMVTVAAGAVALADMLVEKGVLERGDQDVVSEAALVHDLNKERQYWFSKFAQECSSKEDMAQKCIGAGLEISEESLSRIWWELNSKGQRGLTAYDITEEENTHLLRKFGFSHEVIEIQGMVAHHSCPDIEVMLSRLDENSEEYINNKDYKRMAILKLVMHYMDDIVINPNKIDTEIIEENRVRKNTLNRRIDQNRNNPGYKDYNEAWKTHNDKGETAFDMQERVGEMVEAKLAKLLGVDDPKTLPALINERIASNIKNNWEKLHKN